MEVYVDQILVKRIDSDRHITILEEAFNELSHYRMKFNLSKCTFKVTLEKFLGFIVIQQKNWSQHGKNMSSALLDEL